MEASIGSTDGVQPLAAGARDSRMQVDPSDRGRQWMCASPGAMTIRPGRTRSRSVATSAGRPEMSASWAAK
jgi:hypothetical protein